MSNKAIATTNKSHIVKVYSLKNVLSMKSYTQNNTDNSNTSLSNLDNFLSNSNPIAKNMIEK